MREPSEKIRVLIVDDSPFSRQLLADSLDSHWFEIVGFADGFRSALEGYRTYMPDVITMDIAMPEMDGLEVTRRLVKQEPDAKVVIVSSMKDDDLEKLAKCKGAAKFLQKPFEPEALMSVLRSVCDADVVDHDFKKCYPAEFIASFSNFMKRFITDVSAQPIVDDTRLYSSGISILVGITGQYSGRMVLDLSVETSKCIATRLLKQEPKDSDQINDVIAELANIVAGNASSKLNKEFRGAFLRVSPPAIFTGEKFSIASPNLEIHAWQIDTPFGIARLSVGFKKESF
jgi:CheY-like chemotaxis protein/CheY-specific phosphatase CheX